MRPPDSPAENSNDSQQSIPCSSDASERWKESATATYTFAILALGTAGMACLIALLPAAGHDQLWFLLMAQRWLHGAQLYGPEIFDSNTPAIVWLSAIPVAVAQTLGLSPSFAGKLCFALLEAGAGVLSFRMLTRLSLPLAKPQRIFLLFCFITLFAVCPARDFGQRDLLTALLCLPYILAAALPLEPGQIAWRCWVALIAAIGICTKPQFALIPLAIEIYLLVRTRCYSLSRRPEPWILVAVGLLFTAAVHYLAPLYFSQAIPMLRSTYWAIGHLTERQLLSEAIQLHLLGALTIALVLRLRSKPHPLHAAAATLLIAAVAATASYFFQGTGWYYQQLPAITLFGSALALEILIACEHVVVPFPSWTPYATATLVLTAWILTWHFSGFPFSREAFSPDSRYAITSPDPSFFRDLPPGAPVATITTSVDDAIMPIFRYQLIWSQRTNNLWMLPALLRNESPGGWTVSADHRLPPQRLAELESIQHRWMVEDLARWQPRLILVARCQDPAVQCQQLEDRHDNLLAWFLRDPAFRDIFAHYHYLRSSGPFDAYVPN